MADPDKLNNPILVAVWPGMGSVALNAGVYLVEKLGADLVGELPPDDLFEVQQVDVEGGLAKPARLPRSMFFEWRDPRARRDVLIFVGEAQPSHGGYRLCQALLEYAADRGVKRFFTFAAIATQLHPSTPPRVFGAATQNDELVELRQRKVEILKEGEISGLNGVLLAAGAARKLAGICLLGEMPFFAARIPNPGASQAVLEVFCPMIDLELDMADLHEKSEQAQVALLHLLEQLKEASHRHGAPSETGEEESFALPDRAPEEAAEPAIDEAARRKIETLFEQASQDRAKAVELKALLDRHGVFDRYEDRFLDLFRKAE
jgi:proteasome assembly chaperone (PAC2) family protein